MLLISQQPTGMLWCAVNIHSYDVPHHPLILSITYHSPVVHQTCHYSWTLHHKLVLVERNEKVYLGLLHNGILWHCHTPAKRRILLQCLLNSENAYEVWFSSYEVDGEFVKKTAHFACGLCFKNKHQNVILISICKYALSYLQTH